MIGLGIFVSWASGASEASQLASAFTTRVVADGGTVESKACLTAELTYLTNNPVAPDFTGLLNDYSGASAAYSLRLLDNTYSGNAVRVRRASDNTEQDIGFANNQLDTTSLETFCSGTDGFVAIWYDQSGNAANAAQATASKQPQIVSSGTSLGYIQNLTTSLDQLLKSSFSYTNANPFSAFMVVQNFGDAVFGGTSSGSDYYAVGTGAIGSAQSGMNSVSYYGNGSSIGATRGDIRTATSSFAELTTLATPASTREMWLGYFNGFNSVRMQEYIVYDNQTVSRTGVETNIIDHYNF